MFVGQFLYAHHKSDRTQPGLKINFIDTFKLRLYVAGATRYSCEQNAANARYLKFAGSLGHALLSTRLLTLDACKTYPPTHTTVSLRMNPRGSKHVGDNRN